jgi:hypothetical protein
MIENIFWKDKTVKEVIKNCYDPLQYRIENKLSRKRGTTDIDRVVEGIYSYSYVYIIDSYSL